LPDALAPRQGQQWIDTCRALIHKLTEEAPHGSLVIMPKGASTASPDCYKPRELDLISRVFEYRDGDEVLVRLQRIAFIALLKAMREEPGIQAAPWTSSFRSCEESARLYELYKSGAGHLVAPAGKSWHNRGLSFDGIKWDNDRRQAMERAGFYDLLPQDSPHYTFGRRG
jgi:hypothetical protein